MRKPAIFIGLGGLGGLFAVALGAFGAHALKSHLSANMLAIFETGVRYQMYHSLALILVGVRLEQKQSSLLVWSGRLFLLGIFIFSGSLYALSLSGLKILGAITPLGGLAFLSAWICFGVSGFKDKV